MKLSQFLILSIVSYIFILSPSLAQERAKFQTDIPSGPTPWTHTRFLDDDSAFTFAIVADLTGGYREGIFPQAVDKLNSLHPEFVISIGDMIEGYTEDSLQIERSWEQFNGWVGKLDMPFFYMPGNHDVTNNLLVKKWESLYGRTYYHFVYKEVLFLVLNSEEAGEERISSAQADYFKKVLETYPDARQTIMLVHSPLWRDTKQVNFLKIEESLEDRPYTVFAGHTHHYQKTVRHGRDYYVLSTTGGGNNLQGPAFGEFDQIALVRSSGKETSVVNLKLNGILADDVVTDEGAALGRTFLQSSELSYTPMYAKTTVDSQETTVSLTNETDRILRLTGKFFYNPNLLPDIHEINQLVLPGRKLDIPIKINVANTSRMTGPLVHSYTLETESRDEPFLRLESQLDLHVAEIFPVNRLRRVDQEQPDSWIIDVKQPGKLGYYPQTWQGPDDCSLAFSLSYDSDNLYLKAKVTDDDVIENQFRNYWEKDGMEFRFRFPEVNEPNSYKELTLGFSPLDGDLYPSFRTSDPLFAAIPLTSKVEKGGYTTTLTLPIRLLEFLTRQSIKSFFLQVTVYDHDGLEDQYQGTEFSWHADFPGAGRFEIVD